MQQSPLRGFLGDVRVLEVADEQGEFCGKVLAGLGADVVKVEPPGGSSTRRIGPFYRDEPAPGGSLYFWHYNFGKRGITLNLEHPDGRAMFKELVPHFDVVLQAMAPMTSGLDKHGLTYDVLSADHPRLVMATILPFGRTGPWAQYRGSDLVHLALGGVMMNCGYDPDPQGEYDTPPIAPQMWHAYAIAGEYTVISIIAALLHREDSGLGQHIDMPIHQAVSTCTELDFPYWVYDRQPLVRQTGRHAQPQLTAPTTAPTKDGRYLNVMPWPGVFDGQVELLDSYGMASDLKEERYRDPECRAQPEVAMHIFEVTRRLIGRMKFEGPWHEAQQRGCIWAPVRKPEENLDDPHWKARQTFIEVEHPELGQSFRYVGSRWLSTECPWRTGPRAPLIGEHNEEVYGGLLKKSKRELQTLRRKGVI